MQFTHSSSNHAEMPTTQVDVSSVATLEMQDSQGDECVAFE